MSIGINDFFVKHSNCESGNSYTLLSNEDLIKQVEKNWNFRIPGNGEGDCLTRKVLVPIQLENIEGTVFFCPPKVNLVVGMPVKARVVVRQNGEDPYVETYVTQETAEQYGYVAKPAVDVAVVCYSAEALLENNGNRSTDCDWEVVTILCNDGESEPMAPLTMARNMLEMPGGTKGDYTAREFASSIYYHSKKGISVRKD